MNINNMSVSLNRAKYRKCENTRKGPGRPAHNAHPLTCSGEPIDPDEITRRELDRRDRKQRRQLERLARLETRRRLALLTRLERVADRERDPTAGMSSSDGCASLDTGVELKRESESEGQPAFIRAISKTSTTSSSSPVPADCPAARAHFSIAHILGAEQLRDDD